MTFSEVLIKLEEQYGEYDSYSDDYSIAKFFEEEHGEVEGVGNFIDVQSQGGPAAGNQYVKVKYFPQHDLYIKIDGYYSSYDGTTFYDGWGNCKEVRPMVEPTTVYKEIS